MRASGAGRKSKAPEVRQTMFSWFVNVQESLKGRLPRKLSKLKAMQLYQDWLQQGDEAVADRLKSLESSGYKIGKMNMVSAYVNLTEVLDKERRSYCKIT